MFRLTSTLVAVTLTGVLLGGCPIDPTITVNVPGESGALGNANSTPASSNGAGSGQTSGQSDPGAEAGSQSPSAGSTGVNEPQSQGESPAQTTPTSPAADDESSATPSAPSAPQLDVQIAGTWLRESNYWDENSGYSSTLFYVIRLNADGSFVYATQFGSYSGATLLTEPSAQLGHWRTAGGQLTLTYDSGLVEQVGYYAQVLAGDYLMLWTLPNGARMMWNWAG